MRKYCCVFSSLWWLAFSLHAAVNVNVTRVVFNHGEYQRTISLVNDGEYPVVVQSWVDDGAPDKGPSQAQAPFVVIPPVLKMLPGERRELRMLTSGRGLPTDRESLYWLNIYQIPPGVKNEQIGEKVRLALRNQLKVLWRPVNIGVLTEKSINLLSFSYRNGGIYASNQGSWSISLSEVHFGNYSITGIVIPPYSARQIFNTSPPSVGNNKINFVVINDEGNHWGFTTEVN